MKAAVLCNGPSRTAFSGRGNYDLVIGCNIPWTDVDYTVILDQQVVRLWGKRPGLITVPVYFSEKAWAETHKAPPGRSFFRPFLAEIIRPKYPYHSSGHNACEVAIRRGAKSVDVYGCDSWFSHCTISYTREHIKEGGATPGDMKHIIGWRNRWKEIMQNHPDINISFIEP